MLQYTRCSYIVFMLQYTIHVSPFRPSALEAPLLQPAAETKNPCVSVQAASPGGTASATSCRDKESIRPCLLALLAVSFTLVEFIYIAKGVLLITKYTYSPPSKVCLNNTDTDPVEGDDSPEIERHNRAYYFTVAVYAFCSLLRCIEYIPLFAGL